MPSLLIEICIPGEIKLLMINIIIDIKINVVIMNKKLLICFKQKISAFFVIL